MINLQEITDGDIAPGNAPQLMICLVVDTSYSMRMEQRIDKVNRGIKSFIKNAKSDPIAVDSLDLGIISFGGEKPKMVQEFTNVSRVVFEDLVPNGGTPMCEAIRLALEKIKARRSQLQRQGVSLYHPWLIILSDGKADDNSKEEIDTLASKVQKMYSEHSLKGKCIFLGDSGEENDLRKFSPNHQIEKMSAMDIDDFFSQLSQSAASASISSPSEEDDSFYAF